MGLFEIKPIVKEKSILSVEEAFERLLQQISERIGWKPEKSRRCIKKTIGDLVFQINFYSSKWNKSHEKIEIQCECQLWCKKFDKIFNVKSQVGHYQFVDDHAIWWVVTTRNDLSKTIENLCKQIEETVLILSRQFETDFTEAVKTLANKDIYNKYSVRLEFIDIYAGREYAKGIAKDYYDSLSEIMKQDVIRYKQGAKDKAWMINPSNLKYIVDNNILE